MKSEWAGSGIAGLRSAVEAVEERLSNTTDGGVLRVMSVDPGKVTGVSVFWYTQQNRRWQALSWAETLLAGDENSQVLDLNSVATVLRNAGPTDFVIEDFRVLKISMEETFLSPVRIGRKFEWELFRSGLDFFHQFEIQFVFSSEMAAMDDSRLKKLGFYTPGPDHRRDATRHNLLHSRALNNGSQKRFSVAELAHKRFTGGQPFRKSMSLRSRNLVAKPVAEKGVSLRKRKPRRRLI